MRELEVRIIPASERAEAGRIWSGLERAIASPGVLCSWAWTGAWLAQFGDLVEHRFAVVEAGGAPHAIALLTLLERRAGRIRLRSLHLGTVGRSVVYVEHNRLLADPERRAEIARALVRAIHAERDWEELALDGFAPEEAEALLVAEPRLRPHRATTRVVDLEALASGGGKVTSGLPKATRKRVELTRFELDPVEAELVDEPERAAELLDELADLHQSRWAGAGGGLLPDRRVRAFHREAIRGLMPGRALLFRLRAGNETVGCVYGLVERRRLLFYLSGVQKLDDPRLAPGLLTHTAFMQACLDRGLREYDFLAGDARYKRELANREGSLVWALGHRRRPRVLAHAALTRAAALRGGA